jgi:predicted membrane protein
METEEQMVQDWEKSHRRGKVAGGLMIVVIGTLFLGREMGAELPAWLFSWKSLLIGFGLVGFIKHGFRRWGWMVPILIGSAFILGDQYPEMSIRPFLWPVLLILIGLIVMFKPRRKFKHHRERYYRHMAGRYGHYKHGYACGEANAQNSSEDFIDSTAVMGGIQKNILTKNFKGGDVTSVLGGTELNFTQADFEGTATLEVTQVMGGTKLIVPANWQIQSNITTIMGGVEDKRTLNPSANNESNKILVLNGTIVMGGVEITTF